MSAVTKAMDEVGIEWMRDGYYPIKPPANKPYAVLYETSTDIGADSLVMARRITPTVLLYDTGSREQEALRRELSDALSRHNVKHRREKSIYLYNEKLYYTVYDCDSYIIKWKE